MNKLALLIQNEQHNSATRVRFAKNHLDTWLKKGNGGRFFFSCVKNGGRKIVNVLLESDRRCPPTSASDYPDSKRERVDEAARAVPPIAQSPARCPPRREHASNTRTTEEGEEQETSVANVADRTRNSTDGPQGRRPNPRTTPQLLATKVSSSCTHVHAKCTVLFALKFSATSPSLRTYPSGSKDARVPLPRLHSIMQFIWFAKSTRLIYSNFS